MSVILLLPDSFWGSFSLGYLRTWRERHCVRLKRRWMPSDCFKRLLEPYEEALLLMGQAVIPVARTRMSDSTVWIFYYVLLILNPSFHASLENRLAFHSDTRRCRTATVSPWFIVCRVASFCFHTKLLWHLTPLLGNAREIATVQRPFLCNGSANRHDHNNSTEAIALKQRNIVFYEVRAEML